MTNPAALPARPSVALLPSSPPSSPAVIPERAPSVFVIPTHELYWGILDADALPRRGLFNFDRFGPRQRAGGWGGFGGGGCGAGKGRYRAACYLFEDLLPVPVETVHCVFVDFLDHAGSPRLLACAAPLDRLRDAVTRGCVRATPAAIPETLARAHTPQPACASPTDAIPAPVTLPPADSINLLTPGPLRRRALVPLAVRAQRVRTEWFALAAIVTASALVVSGAMRRERAYVTAQTRAFAARERVYDAVLAPPAVVSPGAPTDAPAQPRSVRLAAELRALRRAHPSDSPVPGSSRAVPDIPAALAAILAVWPPPSQSSPADSAVVVRAESISVWAVPSVPNSVSNAESSPPLPSPSAAASIQAVAVSHEHASRFTQSLASAHAWTIDQPAFSPAAPVSSSGSSTANSSSTPSAVRVSVRLAYAPASSLPHSVRPAPKSLSSLSAHAAQHRPDPPEPGAPPGPPSGKDSPHEH